MLDDRTLCPWPLASASFAVLQDNLAGLQQQQQINLLQQQVGADRLPLQGQQHLAGNLGGGLGRANWPPPQQQQVYTSQPSFGGLGQQGNLQQPFSMQQASQLDTATRSCLPAACTASIACTSGA